MLITSLFLHQAILHYVDHGYNHGHEAYKVAGITPISMVIYWLSMVVYTGYIPMTTPPCCDTKHDRKLNLVSFPSFKVQQHRRQRSSRWSLGRRGVDCWWSDRISPLRDIWGMFIEVINQVWSFLLKSLTTGINGNVCWSHLGNCLELTPPFIIIEVINQVIKYHLSFHNPYKIVYIIVYVH